MGTTTFCVNVLYRRNGTWQGQVTWVEGKKTVSFRSVLELLKLLESVGDAASDRKKELGFTDIGKNFEKLPL